VIKPHRSLHYPLSTGYLRPAERKFFIWQDRLSPNRWRWCCTLCDPPCYGNRAQWRKIADVSLPNHFWRRKYHHDYVRRTAA
jgi:hypothetical protein